MIEVVIILAIYLVAGWRIANVVDAEGILPNVLIILFWPLIGVWGLLTLFMFWI